MRWRPSLQHWAVGFTKSNYGLLPSLRNAVLWLAVWPYYWTFRYNTMEPMEELARTCEVKEKVAKLVVTFQARKQRELDFVKAAATLSSAAAIGSLSWPSMDQLLWVALECMYCSLTFGAFSLILAAQHSTILEAHQLVAAATETRQSNVQSFLHLVLRQRPSDTENRSPCFRADIIKVYIWQRPLMLMSWSWVLFLLGVVLAVMSPFVRSSKSQDTSKVAICYLVALTYIVVDFALCSAWMYRAVRKAGRRDEIEE